jgi:pyruvate dehydrogenase E2 component (dihydrolipoamide acetyltransferase)
VSVAASSTRAPHALSPRQRRELLAQAAAPATTSRSADPVASGVTDAGADGFRRAIAEAVAKSWAAIPHFAVGRDVDAVSLLAGLAAARATQPGVTVTDLLLVSLAGALHADGRPSDIGLAVATEWGVLIPVVRLVAGQTVGDIAGIRKDAVERARARRLGSDDATVPFATLSNLGSMGVEWFTGIIPIGQTALLTVGAIVDRPVVHAGGIAIRARFSATLTADHRRFDGADSARLLARFVEGVESVNQEGVS